LLISSNVGRRINVLTLGPLFVGVDGGGTRTTVLVTDARGTEMARAAGGPGRVRAGDAERGVDALADLVIRAIAEAGGGASRAASLCCGLAGAGREPERALLAEGLRRRAVADRVRVTTDAEVALHDAFGTSAGLLVIAGTGSIAWARGPDGRLVRAGGWGEQLGDEGSGYSIGIAALRAVLHEHDGRGPTTGLAPLLLQLTGVASPPDLVAWAATAGKSAIAALAGAVMEMDALPVATALGQRAAADLARHVFALIELTSPWRGPIPVALAGGLIAPGRPLRAACVEALAAAGDSIVIRQAAVDGARGAAALARADAGA
jgi:glucosamine kinase